MKRPFFLSLVLVLAVVGADAQDLCLAEAAGFTQTGNSCTANDISIKQIVVGAVLDGCSSSSDTALVEMNMEVEVSGGGTKYDIAAFLNLQGGSAYSATNECFRDFFDPSVPEGINADGDMCNDIDGPGSDVATLGPITISCSDINVNGIVDFDGCVSYVQNADGLDCQSVDDAAPLNTSKCGCSLQDVPGLSLPELTVVKDCSQTELTTANPTSTCTITYTNTSALGAADFHSFRDDYDETQVMVDNFVIPGGDDVADDGDIITWSVGGLPLTAANIPPLATGTLTYDVTLLGSVVTADPVVNQVCAFWNDTNQLLCDSFIHNADPTAAVISDFGVAESSIGAVVAFRTGSETGTLAFQLERWSAAQSKFVPVGDLIPAIEMAPMGSDYQVVDPSGSAADKYRIVELERRGTEQVHEVGQVRSLASHAVTRSLASSSTRSVRIQPRSAQAAQDGLVGESVAVRTRRDADSATSRVVLGVADTGIQGVAADVLAEQYGLSLQQVRGRIKTGRLSLLKNGEPVAWWTGSESEVLYFYAEVGDDPFSLESNYWLDLANGTRASVEDVERAQVAETQVFESTISHEENNLPVLSIMEGGPDFWFWKILPRNGTITLAMEAPDVDVQATAELRGSYGTFLADPGGVLSVSLNGGHLGDAAVAVSARGSFSFQVPPGTLLDGSNDVELSLNDQTLAIAADTLSLTYQREFASHDGSLDFQLSHDTSVQLAGFSSPDFQLLDLSDPERPLRLITGRGNQGLLTEAPVQLAAGRYFGSDRVRSPTIRSYSLPQDHQAQAADFLIVTHESLLDSAETYADYRRNQGYSVAVWSARQAFDHYSYSHPNPAAIRELTSETYTLSGSEMDGLFLIGNGTFDYRDLLGFGDGLVPSVLRDAGWGIVSSDLEFVDFDQDGEPEVPVGRLPATNASQVDDYLFKVNVFTESNGQWRQRDLLLADNGDAAGNFPQDSMALAPYLRSPQKIHLGVTHNLVDARQELLDAWEEGLRLATYYGHGSGLSLAHENLFENSSLDPLSTVTSTPMLTALTCNIGRFDFPGTAGLGSQLVLNPKGSVAVWSAAGLSVQGRAREATADFVQRLNQDPSLTVGELVLEVSRVAGADFAQSLPSLLGDPLVTLE